MRELAKRRHASEDPERLREITSNAGRVSWKKMTEPERQARIAKMVAARRKRASGRKTEKPKQSAGTKQSRGRKKKK
jgi:hypothetical protein